MFDFIDDLVDLVTDVFGGGDTDTSSGGGSSPDTPSGHTSSSDTSPGDRDTGSRGSTSGGSKPHFGGYGGCACGCSGFDGLGQMCNNCGHSFALH